MSSQDNPSVPPTAKKPRKVFGYVCPNPNCQRSFEEAWKLSQHIGKTKVLDLYIQKRHIDFVSFLTYGRRTDIFWNLDEGTVHDSTGIYSKIDEVYICSGAQVVVDSAYSKNTRNSLISLLPPMSTEKEEAASTLLSTTMQGVCNNSLSGEWEVYKAPSQGWKIVFLGRNTVKESCSCNLIVTA